MKHKQDVLVLGYGEVGKSICGLYKDYTHIYNIYAKDIYKDIKDINIISPNTSIDVLHVAIPYTINFVKEVIINIYQHTPTLVIIDSTVPLHTTKDIYNKVKRRLKYINVVHSPLMGVHPNLTKSMQTFYKIVGGTTPIATVMAIKHFKSIKIKAVKYDSSNDSEAAKLLCTTYYGWNILFMKYVYNFCKQNKLNFEDVYKQTNEIYNKGYEQLGMSNVRRPILNYMPGKIGGHCVTNNLKLLKDIFPLAKVMLKMNDDNKTH